MGNVRSRGGFSATLTSIAGSNWQARLCALTHFQGPFESSGCATLATFKACRVLTNKELTLSAEIFGMAGC
ncbi:MAG: hypothetical protein ACI915_005460 [Gammaproteobacteria bacterium]|jgi:hypothetical protein